MKKKILITDDEEFIRWSLKDALLSAGYDVLEADSGEAALKIIKKEDVKLVLLDLVLPGKDGFAVLKEAKEIDSGIQVIMITAFGSIDNAVKCVKFGAYDYLPKPFNLDEVVLKVGQALKNAAVLEKLNSFRSIQKNQLSKEKMVFESDAMKEIAERIRKINEVDVDVVLITGETGTGKGMMARRGIYSSELSK